MSQTDKNLEEAFDDECLTYVRYLAFARQAEEEGFPNVARLLRATAEGEKVHAMNQIEALGSVRSTVENVEFAVHEEEGDFFRLYPEFIREAQAEDRTEAVMSMTWIQQAEKAHFGLLKQALEMLREGHDSDKEDYYLCTNCGLVVEGASPATCPICKAPQQMFTHIT